jgi:alkanesulfonate monooxygenase SsuD/methylene tetrahydromethanopterin reductase-like flavin-dependent oxidoreductase (luciferase family)
VQAAASEIRSGLAGIGNRLLRFGHDDKLVPPELVPRFARLRAQYQILHHDEFADSTLRNGPLLDELGLLDYLADRFALVGSPADWIERINRLTALGVEQFAIAAVMPDKLQFLEILGREVIPSLQRHQSIVSP